jgi:hypothetical protein
MKTKKKITIKNNKLETSKYLSKLNNIHKKSYNNLYIINSLQQIIRFFNDYIIDSEILEIFNEKALNTRYHLYNLLYYEDSFEIIKEQIQNILEYFFPKESDEYLLLKNKIIINGYHIHKNIGIDYFLFDL